MNDLLLLLNYCDDYNIKYNIINEVDQIRVELIKDEQYMNINCVFDNEKSALFYFNDTYNVTKEDLDYVISLD